MEALAAIRIENLKNYPTRYEVVASHNDGRRLLMGYTKRKSRDGIASLVASKGPENMQRMGLLSERMFNAPAGALMVEGWTIGFTGRTQREAIQFGEIPW